MNSFQRICYKMRGKHADLNGVLQYIKIIIKVIPTIKVYGIVTLSCKRVTFATLKD